MEVTEIAFTICSNNYLAQAKTLGDSLLEYNSGLKFIILLVDKWSEDIDYDFFQPHEIVLIEDIGINSFESIYEKFNIIELNTAVKASAFKYIFERFEHISFTYYFDPDLMFFSGLNSLDAHFNEFDILLTPHINTPIPLDDSYPHENLFLNYGTYNLGFIGIRRSENSLKFLNWWEERTLKFGFIDVKNGYFVDQLWANLVPLFFERVKVLTEYGYNAAPWNLHERKSIAKVNGKYMMTDGSPLVFFHFSAYNYTTPQVISKCYYRYSFDNCPDLVPLFTAYHNRIMSNKIEEFSQLECFYVSVEKERTESTKKTGNNSRTVTKRLFMKLFKPKRS